MVSWQGGVMSLTLLPSPSQALSLAEAEAGEDQEELGEAGLGFFYGTREGEEEGR